MPAFKVNLKYAKMTEVTSSLFVSGVSELKPDFLEKFGITCIINCTNEVPNLNGSNSFERIKLWLNDTDASDLYQHLNDVADKIQEVKENGGKTLVHCLAGVSRSCAVALAYMMKHEKLSLRRAYTHLALKRPLVRPNLGFWRQLIQYEKDLRKGVTTVHIVKLPEDENGPSLFIPDVYMDELRRSTDLHNFNAAHSSSDDEDDVDKENAESGVEKISTLQRHDSNSSIRSESDSKEGQVKNGGRRHHHHQHDAQEKFVMTNVKLNELIKRRRIFGAGENVAASAADSSSSSLEKPTTLRLKALSAGMNKKFTPSLESLPEIHEKTIE